MNIASNSIKDLKKNLSLLIKPENGVKSTSTFIWGPPGVGKSDAIRQIAKTHNLDFIDLRLSQLESSDLRGIPHVKSFNMEEMAAMFYTFSNIKDKQEIKSLLKGSSNEEVCHWIPPEFLPFKGVKKYKNSRGGILLLDEFNRARADVLQAAFQLVLDRKVGLNEIMDNWFIVAAGNLGMADGNEVVELDTALKNRFIHFTVKLDLKSWLEWAKEFEIHEDIVNFIELKPRLLYPSLDQMDKQHDTNIIVTPRSWEKFSDILKANSSMDPRKITSMIGENIIAEAAPYFITFLESKEVVSPQEILFDYGKKGGAVKKKIKNMTRENIYGLNTEVASYIEKTMEEWDIKEIRKAVKNLIDYCNEVLDNDIIVALIKKITESVENKNQQFLNVLLEENPDFSNKLVNMLEGESKK